MNWKRVWTKAELARQVKGHEIYVYISAPGNYIRVTRKALFDFIGKHPFQCQVGIENQWIIKIIFPKT